MPSQKSNHSTLKWGSPGVHLSISITLEWLGVSDNFTPLLVTLVTCLSSCLFQLWRLQIKRTKRQQRPPCTKRVLKNPLHLPPPPPPHPPPTVLPHHLLQKEGRRRRRRRRGTTATTKKTARKKREERKQKEHQDRKERYVGNQGIRRGTSVVYYSYHLWNA